MKRRLAVAALAAFGGLIATPALAQNAPSSTVTVVVTNGRAVDLVQLQAAESGSANWKKVLGALKAGKQAQAVLPRDFNCRVDLHGAFANGQTMDASNVEVCAEKTIKLTD